MAAQTYDGSSSSCSCQMHPAWLLGMTSHDGHVQQLVGFPVDFAFWNLSVKVTK